MAQSHGNDGFEVHDNPYTGGLARFVANLRYEDIPDTVRDRIRLLILDSLGCALYGADLPWTRILQRTLSGLEGGGDKAANVIWGTPLRLSAPHAALINGTQIQGFELDDVHRQGVMCTLGLWCCPPCWPLRRCAPA